MCSNPSDLVFPKMPLGVNSSAELAEATLGYVPFSRKLVLHSDHPGTVPQLLLSWLWRVASGYVSVAYRGDCSEHAVRHETSGVKPCCRMLRLLVPVADTAFVCLWYHLRDAFVLFLFFEFAVSLISKIRIPVKACARILGPDVEFLGK